MLRFIQRRASSNSAQNDNSIQIENFIPFINEEDIPKRWNAQLPRLSVEMFFFRWFFRLVLIKDCTKQWKLRAKLFAKNEILINFRSLFWIDFRSPAWKMYLWFCFEFVSFAVDGLLSNSTDFFSLHIKTSSTSSRRSEEKHWKLVSLSFSISFRTCLVQSLHLYRT